MELVKSRKNFSRGVMGLIAIMLFICTGIMLGLFSSPVSFGHGMFLSGNVFGVYALITLFFSAGFIWYTKSNVVKGVFGVSGVISVIALIFTYSEGMWLWMILGCLGYLLVVDKGRKLMSFVYLSLWFSLGSISGFWIFNHLLDRSIFNLSVALVIVPLLGGLLTGFISLLEEHFRNPYMKEIVVVITIMSLIVISTGIYCYSIMENFMYGINTVNQAGSYAVNLSDMPNLQYSIEIGLFGMLFWIVVQRFRLSDKWESCKTKRADLRLGIFLSMIFVISYLFFNFDAVVLALVGMSIFIGIWIFKDRKN